MYQIALCDDEAADLDKTENILKSYRQRHAGCDFVIERFACADELLEMIREKKYMPDMVFMDIYMSGKSGTDAARELREMKIGCRIIFLTTSREHALDAFGVDAVQYLVKPVTEQMLYSILDRFQECMEEERRRYVLLRIEGRIRRVAVNDIAYCEAQGKNQELYLADGRQYQLHITMTEICEMLSHYQEFVRVGVAYIVNLEHVDGLNAQEMQMANGRRIYLPRGSYKSLCEKYLGYYCEKKG